MHIEQSTYSIANAVTEPMKLAKLPFAERNSKRKRIRGGKSRLTLQRVNQGFAAGYTEREISIPRLSLSLFALNSGLDNRNRLI